MKYLMVCLGNICRSPMAEVILKNKLKNIKSNSIVESRGFVPFHEGDFADSRAQQTAKSNGIDLTYHRASLFNVSDFDNFDKIYVMDQQNYSDVASVARNENDLKKVELLLNVVEPGKNKIVPDPYYGGNEGFFKVWDMIDKACEIIVENFETND